jgi:glycosyltransferase involved in cell wall biosynthesis
MNIGYAVLDNPIHPLRTWIPLEIEEFRRRGHHVIPIARGEESKLSKEIRNLDFMIVHFAKRVRTARRYGVPFGVICHASGIWTNDGEWLKQGAAHPNCKWVGCVSSYHKEKYQEWGIKKPLVYTPICVNTELFTRKKDVGTNIICGARHIPKKGLDMALKARSDICFGEGPLTPQLKKIAYPETKFTGLVGPEELRDIYESGYIYLFPGIQIKDKDMDGQPATVKEALSMGLNVITTPIAGTRDLKHVQFCEANTDKIMEAIENTPRVRNVKGEKYIRKEFSPKAFVDRIMEYIEQ